MGLFDSVFGGLFGGSSGLQRDANVFRDNASLAYLNQANTGNIGAFGSMPEYNRQYLNQTGASPIAESGAGGEQGGTYGSLRQSMASNPFLRLLTTGHSGSPLLDQYQHAAGIGGEQGAYDLTPAQSVQANASGDALNKRRDTALSQFRAQMAARGITDPRAIAAGEAHLHEQFGSAADQSRAGFAENARANRQNALGGLMGAGQSAYNNNENQLANLFHTFLAMAQNGAAGTSNIGGATQQQANMQQQRQDNSLSGLLNLAGFGLGGGFNARPIGGTPGIVGRADNGYGVYGPPAPGNGYGDYPLSPYLYG